MSCLRELYMEIIVTHLPLLILAAIACVGVLGVIFFEMSLVVVEIEFFPLWKHRFLNAEDIWFFYRSKVLLFCFLV